MTVSSAHIVLVPIIIIKVVNEFIVRHMAIVHNVLVSIQQKAANVLSALVPITMVKVAMAIVHNVLVSIQQKAVNVLSVHVPIIMVKEVMATVHSVLSVHSVHVQMTIILTLNTVTRSRLNIGIF